MWDLEGREFREKKRKRSALVNVWTKVLFIQNHATMETSLTVKVHKVLNMILTQIADKQCFLKRLMLLENRNDLSDSCQMFGIFLVWCLSWSADWNKLILTSVESARPNFASNVLRKAIVKLLGLRKAIEDVSEPKHLFSDDQNLKRKKEKR